MKRVYPEESWPSSWKYSYAYDLHEVYAERSNRRYSYAYQNRCDHTLRLLTDVLPADARVLDVAAGQGNLSLTLAEMGYRVTWNDLRAELAEYVQLKHEFGRLDYAPGNVFDLSFHEDFDAVLVAEIIEHVAHPDEFLCKTATFVKPDGYLVMTTPNGAYFRNRLPRFSESPDPSVFESQQFKPDSDGHIFLLHPDEMTMLAKRAGLHLDELVLFTNSLTNGHVKTRHLLGLIPESWVRGLETATQRLHPTLAVRLLAAMGVRFKRLSPSH